MIQFRVNIKGVSFIIFFYIINLFVVYRIFTSMIGKKTNVPLVKKDLRDHKVIYLYMITCSLYGLMYTVLGEKFDPFCFAPFPLVICRQF